jgi:rhodanese-related sulfurtransferase
MAGLKIGKAGGIIVNEYLQTSDPGIYAIGDCVESLHLITKKSTHLPLGSVSTKMGRIAADNICGKKMKFPGSIGTVMFKIFNINVARTGLTQREAEESGYKVSTIIVSGLDKAHYYKNAAYIILKIIADKERGILLGAQGYGRGDIIKSIEILACAISTSMTLADIFTIDLGYYPAFNNPIDIIQVACLMLQGKMENFYKSITVTDFENERKNLDIVDVGPAVEYMYSSIPGSINIPLENLRTVDLPFNKRAKIVLYSKTSSAAYEAYRYLYAKGYKNMYILEGGYLFWK